MDDEGLTKEEEKVVEEPTDTPKEEEKQEEEVKFDPVIRIYYKDYSDKTRKNGENKVLTLDTKVMPEIVKYYTADGVCHQFVDSARLYVELRHKLETIMKVLVTNNAMREAVDNMLVELLSGKLLKDNANEGDQIV